MITVNNFILVEIINENDGILDMSMVKKDFIKGRVVNTTEVYITNEDKMTLKENDIVYFESNTKKIKYEDEKYFISFSNVISVKND